MAVQQTIPKFNSLQELSNGYIRQFIIGDVSDEDIDLIKKGDIKKISEKIPIDKLKILASIKIEDINQKDTNNLLNIAYNYIYIFAFKRKALYAYITKKHIDEIEKCQNKLKELTKSNNTKDMFKTDLNNVKNKLGHVFPNTKINQDLSTEDLLNKLDELGNDLQKLKEFASTSASLHFKASEPDDNYLMQSQGLQET